VLKKGPGLLILLGVENGDSETDVSWLAGKIARLRIFPDGEALMNRSLIDTDHSSISSAIGSSHDATRSIAACSDPVGDGTRTSSSARSATRRSSMLTLLRDRERTAW